MPTIIVSYRRDDTRWITGRIVDRLERDYGKGQVFMDIDAIRPGMDFREHLQNVLGGCDVLIAIIGPQWFGTDEAGKPRLDDPADWVRVEIETALAKKVPVIPVLIDRTRMPKVGELPESMREFAYRQAADLDTGKDFHRHMDHLIGAIGESVARRQAPPPPEPAPPPVQAKPAPPPKPSQDAPPPKPPPKSDGWIDLEAALKSRPAPPPPARAQPRPIAEARIEPRPAAATPPDPRPAAAPSRGLHTGIPETPERTAARNAGIAIALIVVAVAVALVGPSIYQRFSAAPPAPVPTQAQPSAQLQNQASSVVKSHTERFEPAMAQRVVLYEEDPNDANGKRYVGSVIWRSEQVSPGAGKASEPAIRADIEIPERKLSLSWSLRRNTDKSLPASHTIEIMFKLPTDFAPGGITNVPGVLMKTNEQTRGAPLAGLAVKVTNGYFLVGLSDKETDKTNNVTLLKERAWLDIPIVYTNDHRAIIAVEKGPAGDAIFKQVFAAWDAAK